MNTTLSNSFRALAGRLLGVENVSSIDQVSLSFGEPWASAAPGRVFFFGLLLAALAVWFYARYQPRARGRILIPLAIGRALLLALLVVLLADPVLSARVTSNPKPLLYVLIDGTDSMAIEDEMTDAQRARLAGAVGLSTEPALGTKPAADAAASQRLSRVEYLQALLRNEDRNPLAQLSDKYRLRLFIVDRPDGVRALAGSDSSNDQFNGKHVAGQLTTEGQVTALGRAFEDLAQRHSTGHLRGLVVFSDFAQNSGPAPVGSRAAPVTRLGIPVYTVGIGPEAAADLAVSLSAKPLMKKAERDTLLVTLRQTQFENRTVTVKLTARALANEAGTPPSAKPVYEEEKAVELLGSTTSVEFPFTPQETGRLEFEASVEPAAEEVVKENNFARREVSVRDDFLRLLYVAYEPTWEWRFIKEVFHRDKLVGMRGFRTFLRSSDPKVRRSNPLFVPTLTPQRSEFFASDVIFLDDLPDSALTGRFCEMTKEFVSTFGGGLVVISGPRFGPAHLARTPLADMLPVVADPSATARDNQEFRVQLAPEAEQFEFMQLGGTPDENQKAWNNLGALPWYQPVSRVHPLATVLASHPTDRCSDGKTPQPLIAIRKYGKGEVLYLGFNETWRLRRKFGEQYYRQFWGQMIYHLGLRHALGSQKRFVLRTDRPQYQVDDKVVLTVEAYDENFQPLGEDKLVERKLEGELVIPSREGGDVTQTISIPFSRPGEFEARIPVLEAGEHRLRVRDPVTKQYSEAIFQVAGLSVERQSAVRNVALQKEISLASGGKAYDLETAGLLADDVRLPSITETSFEVFPLARTWICFLTVVGLMLSEWLVRKWVHLA